MDGLDDVRAGQHQQVVGAPQVRWVVAEPLAAEGGLVQLVGLDHGAHGAIEDQDAFPEQVGESFRALDAPRVGVRGSGHRTSSVAGATLKPGGGVRDV